MAKTNIKMSEKPTLFSSKIMTEFSDISNRKQFAIDDCQTMITWYDKEKKNPRILFYSFQIIAIVFSAMTPIFILWDQLPKAVQALPAALVSIAVALNAVFKWRENWALRAHTAEALKRELMKYRARASHKYSQSLSEQEALDNFVDAIDTLTMNEVTEWKKIQTQISETQKGLNK